MTAFDLLADALSYPRDSYRQTLTACRTALQDGSPDAAEHVAAFDRLTAHMSVEGLQELYTSTFDLNPECALEIGWHVFGETHDRGGFLAVLRTELAAVGIAETADLPDHLTQVLRLAGRSTPERAAEFAAVAAPALDRITAALDADRNPYANLVRAARATLIRNSGQPPLRAAADRPRFPAHED